MSIHKLSEDYSATGQISPDNLAQIAELGYKSIICNRPDHEGVMQPTFSEIATAAAAVGLKAEYMPVVPGPAQLPDALKLKEKLKALPAPVLAFCGSGARAANLWTMNQENNKASQPAA